MTFDEYVLARGVALVRFARLLTGDEHRAEDLAQDVLAKAYVQWRRISKLDRPDIYVRRMLLNAHHSWWRRAANREIPVESVSDRSIDDSSHAAAERDELWRLVSALPPRQRTIIVLRYYEDYDDETIAELLHCATGTVRTQAKRALTKLSTQRLSNQALSNQRELNPVRGEK